MTPPPPGSSRDGLRARVLPGIAPEVAVAVAALILAASAARGQERPFGTARAATLPRGVVRVAPGARITFDRRLPLSGLTGDLLEIQASVAAGLADRVEARLEGVVWQRMSIAAIDSGAPLAGALEVDDGSTRDAGDLVLGVRVRLTGEPQRGAPEASAARTRGVDAAIASPPAAQTASSGAAASPPRSSADRVSAARLPGDLSVAVQLGVRLPVAGNESGLGRDVTDVAAALLVGWRRPPWRVGAEAGFAILGSPTHAAAQNDQARLGLLAELEPEGRGFALGVEARTAFGDEGPGNELETELVGGGRFRVGGLWTDLAYRRLVLDGRSFDGVQAGVSRTF